MRARSVTGVTLLLAACAIDLGVGPTERIRPSLAPFAIAIPGTTAGALVVSSHNTSAVPGSALSDRAYALVELSTSNGDREQLPLDRTICDGYYCRSYYAQVPESMPFVSLVQRLGTYRAHVQSGPNRYQYYEGVYHVDLWIAAPDPERAAALIRRIPGVNSVDRQGMLELSQSLHSGESYALAGGIPVSIRAPHPGDGILDLPAAGWVYVRYVQPNGSIQRDSARVTR